MIRRWASLKRPTWLLLPALLLCLGLNGTSDPPAWQGKMYQSRHFRYHARTGDAPSPEAIYLLERHLTETLATLGQRWPLGARVNYQKFADKQDYARHSGCPATTRGCYLNNAIRSPLALHPHELIHAYADVLWGRSNRFLSEGLAVALSCQPTGEADPLRQESALSPSWPQLLKHFRREPALAYSLAGRFVTHLLQAHGTDKFAELYRRTYRADTAAFREVFQDVYGDSVDLVWQYGTEVSSPYCLAQSTRL